MVGSNNIRQTFNFNHLKSLDNNLKELLSYEIVENLTAHLLQQNSSFDVLSILRYEINAPCWKHFGTSGMYLRRSGQICLSYEVFESLLSVFQNFSLKILSHSHMMLIIISTLVVSAPSEHQSLRAAPVSYAFELVL
jgi:hypothetical protein